MDKENLAKGDVIISVQPKVKSRKWTVERMLPLLLVTPSILAVAIFVYTFVGATFYTSLSNWEGIKPDLSYKGFSVYLKLFQNIRFQHDLRNTLIFTTLFLVGSVALGLILAILLDKVVKGLSFFRSVFLFPMAVSFVVAGVTWQWVFNPSSGINQLITKVGINRLLEQMGYGPFAPKWIADPTVAFALNKWLGQLIPALGALRVKLGLPMALIPVVIAAVWQLSGFAMAMILAGMGTITNEVREAARIDGASEIQIYRHIIVPLVRPMIISSLIILGYISLKIFDLIYAMTGSGPGFATDVPGIFVYETTFKALKYNTGGAASIAMLIMVAAVIVPYLISNTRERRAS